MDSSFFAEALFAGVLFTAFLTMVTEEDLLLAADFFAGVLFVLLALAGIFFFTAITGAEDFLAVPVAVFFAATGFLPAFAVDFLAPVVAFLAAPVILAFEDAFDIAFLPDTAKVFFEAVAALTAGRPRFAVVLGADLEEDVLDEDDVAVGHLVE